MRAMPPILIVNRERVELIPAPLDAMIGKGGKVNIDRPHGFIPSQRFQATSCLRSVLHPSRWHSQQGWNLPSFISSTALLVQQMAQGMLCSQTGEPPKVSYSIL
jgi:hypothetical protein